MNRTTKIWLVFAGIIVFASFLRLYHITTTPTGLYPDEAMDGNNALEVIQTGHFQVFYVEDNGREGLYVNTLVFFIKAFGNKPWVVRLPAAITGSLRSPACISSARNFSASRSGFLPRSSLARVFGTLIFPASVSARSWRRSCSCGRSISLSNPSGHQKNSAHGSTRSSAASFSPQDSIPISPIA